MTNDWPRQNVFIGTSNDLEFIDVTGNRRFWPVEIAGSIDITRIVADRDQLWAEAVHLYRTGFRWWLPPNIERIAAEQQAQFAEEDIWTGLLAGWIARRGRPEAPFTLAQAMTECLGFPDAKLIPKQDQNRAAACLKSLGFRRRKKRAGGDPAWRWEHQNRNAGTGGNK